MVNDKNLSRGGVFVALFVAMFLGAWMFVAGWNGSISSYFGLRRLAYSEAVGFMFMVLSATATMTFTVKLFRDD